MSLLQQLTEAADSIDPSLLPSSNDVQKLAGAIAHFLEHGEKLLQAAERGAIDVSDLLTGQPEPDQAADEPLPADEPPAPGSPADVTTPAPVPASSPTDMTDAELEAEIQSLSARLATSRQTQADAPAGTSEG